jgi:hypothetical protein
MSSENYSIEDQNAVYFLTFTISDWVDVFIDHKTTFAFLTSFSSLEKASTCLLAHLNL